jgi:hypothetical protein
LAPTGVPAAVSKSETVKQRQSELLKSVQKEQEPPAPKDPPPEYEFIADPPSISGGQIFVEQSSIIQRYCQPPPQKKMETIASNLACFIKLYFHTKKNDTG